MVDFFKPHIVDVPIGTLVPNPWNTNVVAPENEAKLDASIKKFGLYKPVIVRTLSDGQLEIIGGQHRWESAKRLGHTSIVVANLGSTIDDKTAKEIGLVDNGRYGEDDTLALSELLKGLDIDILGEILPYSDSDFASIFAAGSIDIDLALPDDAGEGIPEMGKMDSAPQSHQIMRFKVPIEDAADITRKIELVMKTQGFTGDDSMMNAGNALVYIMGEV